MSLKWTGNPNETGILRKSDGSREKKEELFVFGYSCKLFRDDDKALHIDQGKHLIPWMGDETLKIDRYDARGALHDLVSLEAPPGGFDWRVELSRTEQDVEQLCDEERYRALHTDEDEEEMYKEEELKRLHAAGYGQVGFNYDAPAETPPEPPVEIEEPFEPTDSFKELLPSNTEFPQTQKQNAIIEKTAKFIAHQGTQMEILIKAKQGDNPQFEFLNKDSSLHPYYTALIALVKAGKWPEKAEVVEDKHETNEEYLHPSLASTVIESAPSIPSIHYKPSADCDYTLLISKMRGETLDEYSDLAPGEVAPPGTEPVLPRADIMKAPVMYNRGEPVPPVTQTVQHHQYAAYYTQYMAHLTQTQTQAHTPQTTIEKPAPTIPPTESTGLSLMKNYNTDSESEESELDDNSKQASKDNVLVPPNDVHVVIDKMAAYVARNGDEFEKIVRSKNDPRFTFLEDSNIYHPYYKKLMLEKRGVPNGNDKKDIDKAIPVSFSIKKHKEPEPILPKPALPYESSTDGEEENKDAEKHEEPKEVPITNIPQTHLTNNSNNIPPIVVYKMEAVQANNLPLVKTYEPCNIGKVITEVSENAKEAIVPQVVEKITENVLPPPAEIKKENSPEKRVVERAKDKDKSPREKSPKEKSPKDKSPKDKSPRDKSPRDRSPRDRSPRDKRKPRDRKKDYRSRNDRESRRSDRRNDDRDKERERKRDRDRESVSDRDGKRKKYKDSIETEIISLEDNSDEMIDLTGEQSDSRGEETEADRSKQQQRRRRAAEFLRRVSSSRTRTTHGTDRSPRPPTATLPHSSLASAMVDTLESLYKKKNEEDEKKKRREKRRQRDKRDYEEESDRYKKNKRKKNRSSEEEDSDGASSKKKKRRKEKSHSSRSYKKSRDTELDEKPQQINIDITNTLKELRNSSPTKELRLKEEKLLIKDNSDGEKSLKRDREYSEGEWSSDSNNDSGLSDNNTEQTIAGKSN
ncbi:unnamed protein product [Danaus chrysippus]|uniref:(African queen) hypothetical protein n=1 Tax=Danaus chrysippus TaxID=151541 RepID=A0A8J2Q881_9NEOP|nr:unnamed protein product [Danaus chrysippus]